MEKVNLDALIPRADLEIKESLTTPNQPRIDTLRILDLEKTSWFYSLLRKPDFQRETSEWTPSKVVDLIRSFLNQDLIPSIILWQGQGCNFVIDGAHRLSALIAWVQGDYGNGSTSQAFFDYEIPPEQVQVAQKTRELVGKQIGSMDEYYAMLKNTHGAPTDKLVIAQNLPTLTIPVLWVPGNAKNAERSFFKINEGASPINDTEKKLINARRKPNGIAARAIIQLGTGHQFWGAFDQDVKDEIVKLAKEINVSLFTPRYDPPVKTLDLPWGGKANAAHTVSLVYDLVNLSNNIGIEESRRGIKITEDESNSKDDSDLDGSLTKRYLKNTKDIVVRISSNQASSLGLHPAVYVYASDGRYQITAFMAVVELIKYLDLHRMFEKFTSVRGNFEDILVRNKIFINQIVAKYGSGVRSYKRVFSLMLEIITQLLEGKVSDKIISDLISGNDFFFLKPDEKEFDPQRKKDFSTESKSIVFLRKAFENPLRCSLCNGYLYSRGFNIDHIDDKKYGGIGNADNGQLTHFYCNSIKDKGIFLVKD